MNKLTIATTREQSARLRQCRVDSETADMSWVRGAANVSDGNLNLHPYRRMQRINWQSMRGRSEIAPAWSLSALISMIPSKIEIDEDPCDEIQEYGLLIYPFMGGWQIDYQYCIDDECQCLKCIHSTDIIEVCVQAIEWLTANNYKLNQL